MAGGRDSVTSSREPSVALRLKKLPPYLFAEIDRVKRELRRSGRELIDLGVGDPDLPTPEPIIDALCRAAADSANHRYALDFGMPEFRSAISDWFFSRYGVRLDPDREILPLLGTKEGIAHVPLAFIDPGDRVLVPDPGYPVYRSGTIFAGGEPVAMPLRAENDFLADPETLGVSELSGAKMLFINYPNNPTTAVCDTDYFQGMIEFAARRGIIVCHDAAYNEMTFDGYRAPSILQVPGAMETAIEFHSFSKTFSMTGWRVGFAAGSSEIIAALSRIKSNIDSGIFQAVQLAAREALLRWEDLASPLMEAYRRRRDIMVGGVKKIGWKAEPPKGTFYLWLRCPDGLDSASTVSAMLKAGVVATPGSGFGSHGEGYVRMALTRPEEEISRAVEKLAGMPPPERYSEHKKV